jgi:hypothetical protein
VSGSSVASGLRVSTWPLTMPTLLNGHVAADLGKLSRSTVATVDALRQYLDLLRHDAGRPPSPSKSRALLQVLALSVLKHFIGKLQQNSKSLHRFGHVDSRRHFHGKQAALRTLAHRRRAMPSVPWRLVNWRHDPAASAKGQ